MQASKQAAMCIRPNLNRSIVIKPRSFSSRHRESSAPPNSNHFQLLLTQRHTPRRVKHQEPFPEGSDWLPWSEYPGLELTVQQKLKTLRLVVIVCLWLGDPFFFSLSEGPPLECLKLCRPISGPRFEPNDGAYSPKGEGGERKRRL